MKNIDIRKNIDCAKQILWYINIKDMNKDNKKTNDNIDKCIYSPFCNKKSVSFSVSPYGIIILMFCPFSSKMGIVLISVKSTLISHAHDNKKFTYI